jgi:ribosomal protein S27E
VGGSHRPGCQDCACACHNGSDYSRPPCDVRGGCYRRHDEGECAGCLPVTAQYGLLCGTCHRQILDWLGHREPEVHGLRWVVDWLSENLEPGRAGRRQDNRKATLRSNQQRAPLDMAVFVARQEIHDSVTGFLRVAMEDLDRAGPAQYTISGMLRWLDAQLAEVEQHDFIAAMWQEWSDLMSRSHAVAPWRADPRRLVGVPCPGCHRRTLVIFGGEIDARCTTCRTVILHQHYGLWVQIVAAQTPTRRAA